MMIRISDVLVLVMLLTSIGLRAQNADTEVNGVVVVELFTSQGCSSCPGADRVLSELLQENTKVLGLSFHVDYWDRLGWKDPFSQRAFTQRQYDYAKSTGSSQVYTPQMIVNGTTQFVGSRKSTAQASVTQAKSLLSVPFSTSQTSGLVEVSIPGLQAYQDHFLNVALVERDLTTEVKRGENHGRVLQHDNVVRQFYKTKIDDNSDDFSFELNPDYRKDNLRVIVYIQNLDLEVIAASQTRLN